jgi:hypothetical protein
VSRESNNLLRTDEGIDKDTVVMEEEVVRVGD